MQWLCILCYMVFVSRLWRDVRESHCSQGEHRKSVDYRAWSIGCMVFSFLGEIGIAYVQKKELISNSLIIGFRIMLVLYMFLAAYYAWKALTSLK